MRNLTINGRNIAEYAIVIKTTPAPAEKTAAEFLQKVIETSCGVKLPILTVAENGVFIGTRENDPRVKWDGFRMTTDDKNVYLDGNIPRGTLYAAYDFAEKYLGYRHFAADCEVIPTDGEADVPCCLDIIDNPTFEERRCDWCEFEKHIDFMNHSRLNTQPITGFGTSLGEELGGAVLSPWDCHSFGRLLPGSVYFKDHPEYYSLVNGQRIPANSGGGPGQLCLTNPDVIRIVTENVLKQLRENPDLPFVEVSHCDNHNYCQCEKCAAVDEEEGSHSGTMIRFVNAVAEAVEKEFPHALVRTFAYEYTRVPPKKTKARHNVLVRYCTYDACFRHAIDDPNCELNRETTYMEMKGWGEMCDHMSIWDYVTNWNCFLAPFPNLHSLRENARFFDECHAIHVFEEDSSRYRQGGVFFDLKAYLIGKVLWNAYLSEEEYNRHINEFLEGYYGKGWREIADYMRMEYDLTANRCYTCKEEIDICLIHLTSPDVPTGALKKYWRSIYEAHPYQPMLAGHALTELGNNAPQAIACFERAMELAETDEQRTRIDRSRMAVDYLALICMQHNKDEMTAEEQKEYEAAVALFKEKKKKYNLKYNLHTLNLRGE